MIITVRIMTLEEVAMADGNSALPLLRRDRAEVEFVSVEERL